MDTDDLRIRRWGDVVDGCIGPAFHMRFKPGQVLYGSRRTYLRKVAVADFEGICANTTFVLESTDPSVMLPEMLPFIMQTDAFHEHSKRESKGSVNPYVNFSDLAWYVFALPSLDEQRRLLQSLKATQMLLEELQCATALAQNVVDAWVEDILRSIQAQHRVVLASSLLSRLTVGIVVTPAAWYTDDPAGTPALRSLNIQPGSISMDDIVRLTPEGHAIHRKSELQAGDVVIVRTGRPGDAAVIPAGMGPLNCIDLIVTTPSDKLSPDYFALILNSAFGRRLFQSGTTGTAQQHFNVGAFKKLEIPVPPRTVQESVVEEYRTLRDTTDVLRRRGSEIRMVAKATLRSIEGV